MKRLNYYLGRFLYKWGYSVNRSYRTPRCTLNVLQLGIQFLELKKPHLVIVQIGAFDGDEADPLNGAIASNRHTVLLVEPQRQPYENLLARYREYPNVRIANCAVADRDGELTMHLPKNEEFSTKASLDAGHLQNFAITETRQIVVKALTARSLMQQYDLDDIDVLQIDTEGADYYVLKQFLGLGIHPQIINLETLHLSQTDRESLRTDFEQLGYQFVEYGFDAFALKVGVLGQKSGEHLSKLPAHSNS
jgi:FkbM family methyltransferase